tara:strand:- start:336 stop:599 length:264 start_codon:yes stop_codon:yes gene_type:complete
VESHEQNGWEIILFSSGENVGLALVVFLCQKSWAAISQPFPPTNYYRGVTAKAIFGARLLLSVLLRAFAREKSFSFYAPNKRIFHFS